MSLTIQHRRQLQRPSVEKWGGVDLVFNNAGIATAGAIDELSLEDWQRTVDVDLWSVIYGCRIFTPILKRQGGGYIINTASSAGTLASPEMSAYNVAKAGVVSLSETLKIELDKDNIGVTVICPTVFVTSLEESLGTERQMEANLIRQLQRSKVTPDDIVDHLISAIEKNRLYVITQADAKWGWRFKRCFPELISACRRLLLPQQEMALRGVNPELKLQGKYGKYGRSAHAMLFSPFPCYRHTAVRVTRTLKTPALMPLSKHHKKST